MAESRLDMRFLRHFLAPGAATETPHALPAGMEEDAAKMHLRVIDTYLTGQIPSYGPSDRCRDLLKEPPCNKCFLFAPFGVRGEVIFE